MKQLSLLPDARKEGLVVKEVADEVLVYDLERDKAHCLNQTAALVWKRCDGHKSVAEISRQLTKELRATVDEKMVWVALHQLNEDHLLKSTVMPPPALRGMTRRQMIRTLGIATAVAIPLVTSIVAPTAVQAATCVPRGGACTTGTQCCSGTCTGNVCQ